MVANTSVRELEGLFPNEVIRASAGTGKTFALSNRYLKLLASGVECQSILATTFTKKGAGEILDRIIGRLSDAALDEPAAAKLSSELDWKISRIRARDILHELLRNLHRLEISTLDSFFNRVAKAFSLELRLPPNWEIVEEQEINRMKDRAIQAVLRDDSVVDLLHMLSKGEATRRVASMVRETVDQIYEIYRETGPEPWSKIPAAGKLLSREELDALVLKMEHKDRHRVIVLGPKAINILSKYMIGNKNRFCFIRNCGKPFEATHYAQAIKKSVYKSGDPTLGPQPTQTRNSNRSPQVPRS
ncbi:UvrD-helicase domain-containing protein [Mariniblastus sp.]|nr:UvrD-helicase domain-containing protein [Mariniblastus sp.]